MPPRIEQRIKKNGRDPPAGRRTIARPAHRPPRAAALPLPPTPSLSSLVPLLASPPPLPPTYTCRLQPLPAAMGRAAAYASGRLLWAVALVAVVGTLAAMTMATTTAAADHGSGSCCCHGGPGASVKASADFVEMDHTGRTKPRPMGAAVNAGGGAGTMRFNELVRFGRPY